MGSGSDHGSIYLPTYRNPLVNDAKVTVKVVCVVVSVIFIMSLSLFIDVRLTYILLPV